MSVNEFFTDCFFYLIQLTYCRQYCEGIEKWPSKVPIIVRQFLLRNRSIVSSCAIIVIAIASLSAGIMKCKYVIGKSFGKFVLEVSNFHCCKPCPIFSVQDIQIDCDIPELFNGTSTGLMVYLKEQMERVITIYFFLCEIRS